MLPRPNFANVPIDRIDIALRAGLGNIDEIYLYRLALIHPEVGVQNIRQRDRVVRMFKLMRDPIYGDQVIYNRIRPILRWITVSDTVLRRVIKDPGPAMKSPFTRPRVLEMFHDMRDWLFGDAQFYDRFLKWMKAHRRGLREQTAVFRIQKMADFYGKDADTLMDVFDRGFLSAKSGQDPTQSGYERVKSFVRGETDQDLAPVRPFLNSA